MPQSTAIAAMILGGVLLLIAILGGNFKIFGAEIGEKVSGGPLRFLAGMIGITLVLVAIKTPGPASNPAQPKSEEPKVYTPPASPTIKPAPQYRDALIIDPPSNVRRSPIGNASILCSLPERISIRIYHSEGNWYSTDACNGTIGYIHSSQIRFLR